MSAKNGVSGTGQSAVLNLDPSQDQADLIQALVKEVSQLRAEVKSLRAPEETALQEGAGTADTTPEENMPVREGKRRISARDLRDIFD